MGTRNYNSGENNEILDASYWDEIRVTLGVARSPAAGLNAGEPQPTLTAYILDATGEAGGGPDPGSIAFDGDGDYLTTSGTDFAFTGDFTVEMWLRFSIAPFGEGAGTSPNNQPVQDSAEHTVCTLRAALHSYGLDPHSCAALRNFMTGTGSTSAGTTSRLRGTTIMPRSLLVLTPP